MPIPTQAPYSQSGSGSRSNLYERSLAHFIGGTYFSKLRFCHFKNCPKRTSLGVLSSGSTIRSGSFSIHSLTLLLLLIFLSFWELQYSLLLNRADRHVVTDHQ